MEFLKTKRFRIFIFKENFIFFFFGGGRNLGRVKVNGNFVVFSSFFFRIDRFQEFLFRIKQSASTSARLIDLHRRSLGGFDIIGFSPLGGGEERNDR